ncbi:MAG: hypothetical protein J0I47_12785 [Sphingomonas sp.]|uniref:hypothetical protein n=1 Tax=Sphingomonas sp. TaxID=28214 RepID=UPI001AD04E70|nr:hypothetical protein [Sphingomonas sp.]MBN8809093.1 hypothetical protein [Sphingomonas sp.]
MALFLPRLLRTLFAGPAPAVTTSDAPFDTEAAIARYLTQREGRAIDRPAAHPTGR